MGGATRSAAKSIPTSPRTQPGRGLLARVVAPAPRGRLLRCTVRNHDQELRRALGTQGLRSRPTWSGNRGHLKGYEKRKASGEYVGLRDFRKQAGVYVLYEGHDPATQRVIYVGETDKLFNRLRTHTCDQLRNRWQRFSWFGLYDVATAEGSGIIHADPDKKVHLSVRNGLHLLEGMLIKLLEPPLNMQREKWKDATEYFQWVADDDARSLTRTTSDRGSARSDPSRGIPVGRCTGGRWLQLAPCLNERGNRKPFPIARAVPTLRT